MLYQYLWAPDYRVMPKYDHQLERTQFNLSATCCIQKHVHYMTAEANIVASHLTFAIQLAYLSTHIEFAQTCCPSYQ